MAKKKERRRNNRGENLVNRSLQQQCQGWPQIIVRKAWDVWRGLPFEHLILWTGRVHVALLSR